MDELNEKIGEQNKKINQKMNEIIYIQRVNEELKKKLREKEEGKDFPLNIDKNKRIEEQLRNIPEDVGYIKCYVSGYMYLNMNNLELIKKLPNYK